jgi:predicted nucleic acid-binding Zn ribbon protein
MLCPTCKTEIAAPAKFCSGCGTDVSSLNEKRSRSEFTIGWVGEILRADGYEVRDIDATTDGRKKEVLRGT